MCHDADELRTTRRTLATAASTALLVATLDHSKTHDEKVAGADQILGAYLSFAPGCTFDNGWCQAPERQYKDTKNMLGCGTAGGPGAAAGWGALGLFALLVGVRRRRWRADVARRLVMAVALTFTAGGARAQAEIGKALTPPVEPTATSTSHTTPARAATATRLATPETITTTTTPITSMEPNTHAPPAPTIVAVEEPGPRDPSEMAWGAYLGSAGSFDKPGAALQLGARLKVSKHCTFRLDGTLGLEIYNG